MSDEMVWYIARASGIVTWALLAASVSWGLALTAGTIGRRPRPAWLLDLHRFMAGRPWYSWPCTSVRSPQTPTSTSAR